MRTITVGSRKSKLALVQTHWVIEALKAKGKSFEFDVAKISTKGDRILDVTLSKIGGKGLFVKEIERAMFEGEIDMAVHSMKDMPSVLPEGLMIACIPERADHRDAFISKQYDSLAELPEGAIVGTSSLRRGAQMLIQRPDLEIRPVRGNIDTRLGKLEEGQFDAIILAASGLARMGWSEDVVTEYLEPDVCLPAVGQGALAIECREDDTDLRELLSEINDEETFRTVSAERAFLRKLEGGCETPIAAYAVLDEAGDGITLTGLVASTDGKTVFKGTKKGTDPIAIGEQLAAELLDEGAKAVLDELKTEFD
ncbi:MAG TPA: hydroxymethylbilane synthase [Bacillales bacterium]|nr:hydroxymethylbilane synthase [Bacillales bacterium]